MVSFHKFSGKGVCVGFGNPLSLLWPTKPGFTGHQGWFPLKQILAPPALLHISAPRLTSWDAFAQLGHLCGP